METEASQVFVANQGRMLPIVAPRRRIRPDDGKLDVILVRASGAIPALIAGWDAVVQEDLGETDGGRVFRTQARKVEIETEPDRLVEVDGSVIGETPVSIKVDAKALTCWCRDERAGDAVRRAGRRRSRPPVAAPRPSPGP